MSSSRLRWCVVGAVVLAAGLGSGLTVNGGGRGAPPRSIDLRAVGVYRTLLYDEGAAEIAAHDSETRRAFLTLVAETS
jgi:hypothetical protein